MKPQNEYRTGLIACFVASLFSFYDLFQLSLMNSTAAGISSSFHLSSVTLGFLASAYVWANALALIPLGILIDRYTSRPIALLLIVLSAIACFFIAISHSWKIIVFMRFVQGITSAASFLTCTRMAIRWFDHKANTAIGIMISIALLGGLVGNNLFDKVVLTIGWRMSFFVSGMMALSVLILAWLFLYEKQMSANKPHCFTLNTIKQFYHQKNILLGIYLGLMSLPIFILAAIWGNLYLQDIYRLTQIQAGTTAGLLFLGLIVGSPIVGIIADKFNSTHFLMKIGAIFSLIIVLPLIIQLPLSLYELMLLFFLLGVVGSTQNVVFVLIAKTNPFIYLSTIIAIASVVENLVGACGQFGFGYLLHLSWHDLTIKTLSPHLHQNYLTATTLFPIAFISAFVICFLSRRFSCNHFDNS